MNARLEVIDPGFFVTVQDGGRRGYRNIGVPLAGALDPLWLAAANALVGNAADAPALEIRLAGPLLKLEAGGPLRLALVGHIAGERIDTEGTRHPIPAQSSFTLHEGESFKAGRAEGTAYLAINGGFAGQYALGSYSTYERAGLGGVDGHALRRGDAFSCTPLAATPDKEARASAPPGHAPGALRVMLGPQDDHFETDSLNTFLTQNYTVSPNLDRMGMRLEGPLLRHNARGADIVSDGVTPGVIQCPANGQPIILLADGQTTGGYAKIACIIRADLPRLAHLRPGDTLAFRAVTRAEATEARQAAQRELTRWIENLERFSPGGGLESAGLLAFNLISGVTAGSDLDA